MSYSAMIHRYAQAEAEARLGAKVLEMRRRFEEARPPVRRDPGCMPGDEGLREWARAHQAYARLLRSIASRDAGDPVDPRDAL